MSSIGLSQYLLHQPILTLLLICHFLSDFHLQSQKIADRKDRDWRCLGIHLIGVALPLIFVTVFIPSIWRVALLLLFSHAIIDIGKPYVAKWFKQSSLIIFLIDQALHLSVILLLAPLTREMMLPDMLVGEVLTIILFILLITKPTNVAFKLLFQKYQPKVSQKMDTISGAGAMIGLLERVVMGICILFYQFASIGLVFTAKSIARYNKISENPAFAEYYLIGSLFSILSVLIAAWICLL
ncbi:MULTISPECIES: DUF3307 domain-containing protein [unclassified Streptococcus]|uniref:DUF3307 domain-containing protein n=1 Tax=unclassified Streptococcus TaxID=2608887 RepID=UPI00211AD717|nr:MULTISPECIES: DUF3307 domain-containing protein [unclassified Streptococcus]MCQ9212543.1 DUF3307 domain-containing protein [Streptococcus sp. B01]MCQ9213882.1 DUF3307 domain-containing protein [Streptococcus sp. O1]